MTQRVALMAVALLLALGTLVSAARPAVAAFDCTDLAPANVAGNLTVPAGQFCQLNGGSIGGNVFVDGNNQPFIGVTNSVIGGSLSLSGNAGPGVLEIFGKRCIAAGLLGAKTRRRLPDPLV